MSDEQQGDDWWRASDGRWYPPEATPAPPTNWPPQIADDGPTNDQGAGHSDQPLREPWWRRPSFYVVLAVAAGVAAVVGLSIDREDDTDTGTPAAFSIQATVPQPSTTAPAWEVDCPGSRQRVIYRGGGSATGGSITAALPDGTSQADVALPIRNKSGTEGIQFCTSRGEFLYISIQNRGERGTVTCEIEVDGRVVASNSSSGAYSIVTCDA